jgi:hypothetical protein
MGKFRSFVTGVTVGLTAAAIGQELQKPPAERTWKGKVAGVPYNFRLPEWGDIAREYWNPESDQILAPNVIGLGWGVNFAALASKARQLGEAQQARTKTPTSGLERTWALPDPVER